MNDDLGFVHRWVPATRAGAPVLLLLHGTGGTEDDLLSLGQLLHPGAALLSPRGQVLERGAPRFFRRLAEGVFDLDDLKRRADDLAGFLTRAAERYAFPTGSAIAVGYSNGANIASGMMLRHPAALRAALLFRPMVPYVPDPMPDLSAAHVLLSAGDRDPIVPVPEVERLTTLLRDTGAAVDVHWQRAGHELVREAIDGARDWLSATLATNA